MQELDTLGRRKQTADAAGLMSSLEGGRGGGGENEGALALAGAAWSRVECGVVRKSLLVRGTKQR